MSDGDNSPTNDVPTNEPESGAETGPDVGTNEETEVKERKGRPQRSAKSTSKGSEYYYY